MGTVPFSTQIAGAIPLAGIQLTSVLADIGISRSQDRGFIFKEEVSSLVNIAESENFTLRFKFKPKCCCWLIWPIQNEAKN